MRLWQEEKKGCLPNSAEVIKEGKLGDKFHAISDAHAEMMIKVQRRLRTIKMTAIS